MAEERKTESDEFVYLFQSNRLNELRTNIRSGIYTQAEVKEAINILDKRADIIDRSDIWERRQTIVQEHRAESAALGKLVTK